MDAQEDFRESEHDKIRAEINKMIAETVKLGIESRKLDREMRLYPFVALGGVMIGIAGTAVALVTALLK